MAEPIERRGYAYPEALVSTAWVADRLEDPGVRIVECNEDPLLYAAGHVPGAVELDWRRDLEDPVRRDYLDREGFEALARRLRLTPETTVVLYGDKNNWWAAYAFWVLQLFNHRRARLMDGGRLKWKQEGRDLVRAEPGGGTDPTEAAYRAPARDDRRHRAFRDQVRAHMEAGRPLVDVRTPEEYSGERLHLPDYPNEGALRAGHVPGAVNVPWDQAIDPADGTFRSAAELRRIYGEDAGLDPGDDVVVYCRIGERSAHTWFVLAYLLGFGRVRNYDGSWTEWGNLVGAPIER